MLTIEPARCLGPQCGAWTWRGRSTKATWGEIRIADRQLQIKFHYTHVRTENDVLLWDHLGAIHRAIADYRPDEIRLICPCHIVATKGVRSRLFTAGTRIGR